jgi:hypothetical protein
LIRGRTFLTHPKYQIQPWQLKLATKPPIEKVFENAISGLAQTGNREAIRKALQDYAEKWIRGE